MCERRTNEFLISLLEQINTRQFHGNIAASISWDVPVATESSNKQTELTKEEVSSVESAIEAIDSNNFAEAAELLLPAVRKNHDECRVAFNECVRKLRGTVDHKLIDSLLSKANNSIVHQEMVSPGCSFLKEGDEISTIHIHPDLSKENVPKYVINYVIYHEMLHIHLPTDDDEHHSKEFMAFDRIFPNREKAIKWLENNGFKGPC